MPHFVPDLFLYCPRCAVENPAVGSNPFQCPSCDLLYYFNPGIAVAGVVTDEQGRVLLLRRAKDPGKGKFGLPGGFVDPGESTEDAFLREVKEEVNLDVCNVRYITSQPNTYSFRGVTYMLADIFYACDIVSLLPMKLQAGEIDDFLFCHPTENELSEMAFESNRIAVEMFLRR